MKIGDLVETEDYGDQHIQMSGIVVGEKIYKDLPIAQRHVHVYWRNGCYDSIVDPGWLRILR